MKTKTYEKEYIYNILKRQIRSRIDEGNWMPTNPVYQSTEIAANLFWDTITDNGVMHIGKVRLPDIRWFGDNARAWHNWPMIYADSMMIHHLFDDDYCETNVQEIEDMRGEGPYCFENVTIERGDVVIDAGAYIGDWASVASAMGGEVYAFDPSPTFEYILREVANLNRFTAISCGLGDNAEPQKMELKTQAAGNQINSEGSIDIPMTTIDKFAAERNLKIDFIKSDVEGFERNLLRGAANTLLNDEPNLAIRTYHFKEDRKLLPDIVKKINPKYKIIERQATFYAYVP